MESKSVFDIKRSAWLKYLVALLMGLSCMFLSKHGIEVHIGEITIDVPWALVLPMMVSMAYGTPYGIVAGLAGGATYVFYLWPGNGWANILTSSLFLIFFAGLGYVSRDKLTEHGYRPLIKIFKLIGIFSLLLGAGYMTLFNRFLSLNPPFWTSDTISSLDQSFIFSFVVKDTINLIFLGITTDVLLLLPSVRRLFGLPVHSNMVHNHSIFLSVTSSTLIIWGAFVAMDMVLFPADYKMKQYLGLALFQYVGSGMIVSRVVINYISQRIDNEMMIQGQNSLLDRLNKDLIEANLDLERARLKAEESDRLKTAFLANISHEIRTPMNGIMGFSELVGDESIPAEEKNRYLKIIRSSGRQLMTIIDEIIDISKIETGQVKLHMGAIKVSRMVDHIYAVTKLNLPGNGDVEMILEQPGDAADIVIWSDEGKLKQILTNLLNNAIKFTDSGSIRFGWKLRDGGKIEFYVSDTGIGIDPSEHQSIFNRFNQASNHDTSIRGGSGLGLSISKGLAGLLEGDIVVESERGRGSTFRLLLDASGDNISVAAGRESMNREYDKRPAGSRCKILIAEDNDASFDYYNILLKKMGCVVVRAHNGAEAIGLFREHDDIKIVLMDLRMPGIGGYEAAGEIKRIDPRVPVIAQSAYTIKEDDEGYMKAGFDGYLTKPVKKDDLVRLIHSLVETGDLPGVEVKSAS